VPPPPICTSRRLSDESTHAVVSLCVPKNFPVPTIEDDASAVDATGCCAATRRPSICQISGLPAGRRQMTSCLPSPLKSAATASQDMQALMVTSARHAHVTADIMNSAAERLFRPRNQVESA